MSVKKCILVIDDDTRHDKMMSFLLISKGFDVQYAVSGEEAIEKLKSKEIKTPSLILLDMMMPQMDGFATFAVLKEIPETKGVPVIMLTAVSDSQRVQKALDMGAKDYIVKPFSPSDLMERINRVLK
ncbi:MAG: response regulator [Deltaproteobacteria bacterium]|nr:response regulator [Deltaproteobacteria bacterium]